MAAGLNWLDYLIIAIIGFGALYGLAHGVLRMATSILSFLLGIYAAWSWHQPAAAFAEYHLHTSATVSALVSYVVVFVVVFVAIEFAGQRLIALAHIVNLNLVDRLGGAVLGALLAAVFVGVDIAILTALLPPKYQLLQNSELAPRLLAYDELLVDYLPPQVRQVYEDRESELARYWNGKNSGPARAPDPAH